VFGIKDVFLDGRAYPWSGDVAQPEDFFVSRIYAAQLSAAGRLSIFRVDDDRLIDVTQSRVRSWPRLEGPAARVNLSDAQHSGLLDGWEAAEPTGRWMGKTASVTIHTPESGDDLLYVAGYCPADALRGGPVRLTISIEGERQPPVDITRAARFSFSFRPPGGTIGRTSMRVDLDVDRTFRPNPNSPERGLLVTTIEVR
jgi:hypothetical protein